jgi:hypothetical protein
MPFFYRTANNVPFVCNDNDPLCCRQWFSAVLNRRFDVVRLLSVPLIVVSRDRGVVDVTIVVLD